MSRGGEYEDAYEIFGGEFEELLCALPVNVEDDVLSVGQGLFYRGAGGAVVIVEDFGVFQHFVVVDHFAEFVGVCEDVVFAADFSGAALACGH